jgi:hypothetical protein
VPVLFTGTLRENLDPFRAHTDAQVWAALRRAHLAPLVEANTEVTLSHPLACVLLLDLVEEVRFLSMCFLSCTVYMYFITIK